MLAESRTYWRTGVRHTSGDLKLDQAGYFFHISSPAVQTTTTWIASRAISRTQRVRLTYLLSPASPIRLLDSQTTISLSFGFFHLRKTELDRCSATENAHQHANFLFLRSDLFNNARKV